MKTETTLQMYPLLRIVLPLCSGIVLGYNLVPYVSFPVWLSVSVAVFVLTMLLRNYCVCQSVGIYLTLFMVGGTLVCGELDDVDVLLPSVPVDYAAVVVSEPVEKDNIVRCDLIIVNTPRPVKIKAAFYKNKQTDGLTVGDGVEAFSLLERPRNVAAGNFDYASYLRCHGFSATTFIYSYRWKTASVDMSCLSRIQRTRLAALRLRHKLLRQYIARGMDRQTLAVVSAVTLGDKSALSGDTKSSYSVAGASHVLALSGLHLSMICSFLCLFAFRFRRTMLFSVLLVVCVWAFTFIVGMSPSVMRAAIMLTVYIFCEHLNRSSSSLNILASAALVLLIMSPLSIYDVGFQMSFMAMLAILLFYKPFYSVIPQWAKSFCVTRWLVGITVISVAAQIGAAPLTAYYFGNLPCYFFLTNIIVIPLIMLVVGGSLLFFLFSFSSFLQEFVAHCMSAVVGIMDSAVTCISSLPGAAITQFTPSAFQVLMAYVLVFAMYMLCGYVRKMITLFPFGSEP